MTVTVVMPSTDELMRQLIKVDSDAYLVHFVYPYVCRTLGGQGKTGSDVMADLAHSMIFSATLHRLQARFDDVEQALRKFAHNLLVDELEILREDALRFLAILYPE